MKEAIDNLDFTNIKIFPWKIMKNKSDWKKTLSKDDSDKNNKTLQKDH